MTQSLSPTAQAIVRDDDISYFTTPALLDAVYTRLWERRIPVCLSVIPKQRANVRVQRRGRPYDPNVPPKFRGQDKLFPVTENPTLCEYLRKLAREGLVELMLHGYSHDWWEFATEDTALLRQKLDDGMSELRRAFPDVPIRAFIAPYDRLSPVALRMIHDLGLDVCVNPGSLGPDYALLRDYQGYHLDNGRKLFAASEYFFNWRIDPNDCFRLAMNRLDVETLIVVNHYWMFNLNWKGPNPLMMERWNQYLDALLAQPRRFTTFSDGSTEPLPVR